MKAVGVLQHVCAVCAVCAVYLSIIVRGQGSRRAQFGRVGTDTEKVT
jgi:hypothetical protein